MTAPVPRYPGSGLGSGEVFLCWGSGAFRRTRFFARWQGAVTAGELDLCQIEPSRVRIPSSKSVVTARAFGAVKAGFLVKKEVSPCR